MNNLKLYAFADEASPVIDEQITAMKRNNLSGLEIRNVDNVNVSEISDAKAKEVYKKISDAGFCVWSIGSPIGKIDIANGNFAAHTEKFKRTLEIAEILNCKNIRLFSFYIPKDTDHNDYKNEVIDRLGKFCELAVGSGINLCHENEKGIYGDIPERCDQLLTALPQLKGIFDPANYVQCGVDTAAAWQMLKSKTYYLHIKDALSDGSVVPAGCGIGNVKEIIEDYSLCGGTALTLEPHLKVFKGLEELERAGDKSNVSQYSYPDNNTAFDAACSALRALI